MIRSSGYPQNYTTACMNNLVVLVVFRKRRSRLKFWCRAVPYRTTQATLFLVLVLPVTVWFGTDRGGGLESLFPVGSRLGKKDAKQQMLLSIIVLWCCCYYVVILED